MKKTNLAEALQRVEQKPHTSRAGRKAEVSTTREGKKTIAGFFPLEVSTQLKMIGLTNNKTVQDLLAEALNGLFTKYGKSPIA